MHLTLTIVIDDLEKLFRVGSLKSASGQCLSERVQFEIVHLSYNLSGLGGLHSTLRQVATLIVEETVGVSAPGDTLHQNPA